MKIGILEMLEKKEKANNELIFQLEEKNNEILDQKFTQVMACIAHGMWFWAITIIYFSKS
jgi:hypothetical protein